MVTRYRPRTAVERWQIQDRLRLRLRRVLPRSRPHFYETADGELAVVLWVGMRRLSPATVEALRWIDGEETAG